MDSKVYQIIVVLCTNVIPSPLGKDRKGCNDRNFPIFVFQLKKHETISALNGPAVAGSLPPTICVQLSENPHGRYGYQLLWCESGRPIPLAGE